MYLLKPHGNTLMGHLRELINKSMKYITFDIMLKGRFVCTMRMPITVDDVEEYINDKPVVLCDTIYKYVEDKRPSLKCKPYKISF